MASLADQSGQYPHPSLSSKLLQCTWHWLKHVLQLLLLFSACTDGLIVFVQLLLLLEGRSHSTVQLAVVAIGVNP